jgi:hypothetical protein
MEPTVLAGAVEFSPAEIALIVAVLAAAFVVVTAPGWVVLSVVMGRRSGATSTAGRVAARAGGALAGLAISVGAGSLASLLTGGPSWWLTVPAAWGGCWALAALLHRGRAAQPATGRPVNGAGWGR